MSDDRAMTSYSFSRFGRRLDQQKTTCQRTNTPNSSYVPPVKINRKSSLKGDWLFRRIDRTQGMQYIPQQNLTTANREYKPHFDVLEKHVPNIQFAKQTKRRSTSLQINQYESSFTTIPKKKIKLMIPFDKLEGRKDIRRESIDKFYQPFNPNKTNNAHSFESYSARKSIVEREPKPDYEVQKSFNITQVRRATAVDFSKTSTQKSIIPLTALLDYDIKIGKHIQGITFDKQIPRERESKIFKQLFSRIQAKVQ